MFGQSGDAESAHDLTPEAMAETATHDRGHGTDAQDKKSLSVSKAQLLARSKSPEKQHLSADASQPTSRPLSTGKGYSSKFMSSLAGQSSTRSSFGDGKREGQGMGIDPLSHAILQRTHTSALPASKTPSAEEDGSADSSLPPAASRRISTDPQAPRTDGIFLNTFKDRRNRTSFFSRFVAPKKKEAGQEAEDDESEKSDKRAEGVDIAVFSQPIGYAPQFPPPPKYIKVRSHGKKEKDFDRVFLAQELRGKTGVEIAQSGGRPMKSGMTTKVEPKKDDNAVWAMEFSKDGKHLAAGGKDYVVRVWAVLSNKEERQVHEQEEDAVGQAYQRMRLSAPVFKNKTTQEYSGHTASILDLSWSKNNFLLSSSMDKTVRLWHISREECLCCFKHTDFVTSIQFHPRDDRFFLAGSLDSKLRLWSIPDKSVAYSNTLPDFITAVAFSPDGKTAIAGCLNGLCLFYDTEGLKYQTQMHVRSAHGKNAKGSKVTGIQAITNPPDDPNGEVKILVTSNDSRIRVYNLRDKGLDLKLKGNENSSSQIHATFSDDAKYIICGSEDRKAYIWSASNTEFEKDKIPVEMFEAHQAVVTKAIISPSKTKILLSASGDPIFDLCNPPPVTLVSRTHSMASIQPSPQELPLPTHSNPPTPATPDFSKATKPEESPSYISRCSHPNGNIVVTADIQGNIKVFRQDCAFTNRARNNSDAVFTRKMLRRTNSVATKNSTRSSRNSLQLNPSTDRILSWRQSINNTTSSLDSHRHNSFNSTQTRSMSPRKSVGAVTLQPPGRHPSQSHATSAPSPSRLTAETASISSKPSDSMGSLSTAFPASQRDANPLMLKGDQSYMFWNHSVYQAQVNNAQHRLESSNGYSSTAESSQVSVLSPGRDDKHLRPKVGREPTNVSVLSSEATSEAGSDGASGGEVTCGNCSSTSFKVRVEGGGKQVLVCQECGTAL